MDQWINGPEQETHGLVQEISTNGPTNVETSKRANERTSVDETSNRNIGIDN